ncbi:MAG: FAD-dependent monooxygenase [Bacteroidetes bacterium]|nr:FAD-dependent monooxygenase [Bacteroidota bacterium]MCB0540141.1 FAD-dependent monooxygenase [Bacteroidota bacterium]
MENKNILISGAGIAGTALAFWLKKFGFNPTIVEVAPKLREGGYAIDFWGAGFDVAEKMEILPDLSKVDLKFLELSFVDKNNRRRGGMNYRKVVKWMNGRAFTLLRSDLAKTIYNNLDKDIEIIFGDKISKIEQSENEVSVTFQSGKTRSFDLVVGADGLHSNVRNMIFGNEAQFEKYYGYYTASYTIPNPKGDKEFSMYNVPSKQVALYPTNENTSAVLYVFASPEKLSYNHHDIEAQKQILRNQFENIGWRCADLIAKIDTAPDFYFDVVSQIQMKNWSKNRVVLVGDACDCPSLLSGQGSTLAMVGAYILAGELKNANGNFKMAFEQYQNIFKEFIDDKQLLAQKFAKQFVPKSTFGIWLRNVVVGLMFLPFVSKLLIKQFTDKLKLKDY